MVSKNGCKMKVCSHFHRNKTIISVRLLQYTSYIVHITETILQKPYYRNHITETILQKPYYRNHRKKLNANML